MAIIEYEGMMIKVDEEGYLINFGDWNEKVACALAEKEGISKTCPLSKERMDIIKFMREYYKENKAFPIFRAVCLNVHQPKECTYTEFPSPLIAWKVAGLPKPTPELYAYLTV
ncbi:MAG: TusE/DsrC/DsvC family sulfur relay protein [Nitrospirota bacterium]